MHCARRRYISVLDSGISDKRSARRGRAEKTKPAARQVKLMFQLGQTRRSSLSATFSFSSIVLRGPPLDPLRTQRANNMGVPPGSAGEAASVVRIERSEIREDQCQRHRFLVKAEIRPGEHRVSNRGGFDPLTANTRRSARKMPLNDCSGIRSRR